MNISQELINDLRFSLADDDGDENTRLFTDKEIEKIAVKAESINHALFLLYALKADKVVNENNRIKKVKAGNEEVEKLTCIEMSNAYIKIANNYKELWLQEKKEESQFLY